jgi:hypothetical protein
VNDLPEPVEQRNLTGSRGLLERAVLVPAGAVLLAAEEVLGLAATLADAEKAGRELLHFEQRGARARRDVQRLMHHQRGRVADRLDTRIEHARLQLNEFAAKGKGISSKIRPQMPTKI